MDRSMHIREKTDKTVYFNESSKTVELRSEFHHRILRSKKLYNTAVYIFTIGNYGSKYEFVLGNLKVPLVKVLILDRNGRVIPHTMVDDYTFRCQFKEKTGGDRIVKFWLPWSSDPEEMQQEYTFEDRCIDEIEEHFRLQRKHMDEVRNIRSH